MEIRIHKMGPIYEIAHKELNESINSNSLETIWYRAGLECIVSNRIIDPPIEQLKRLTEPQRAWDNQPWPPELNAERAQCLSDCGFLAIINKDCSWLEKLDKLWLEPKVGFDWHLLSRGQIGLALHRYGLQTDFWIENSRDWFLENDAFPNDTPRGYAWIALSREDLSAARLAINDFRIEMENWKNGWNEIASNAVWRILSFPGKILFLELRVLEALVSNE